MTSIILFIALPLAIAAGCVVIRAFFKFDAALRDIYDTDRERWRRLDSPIGFFWIPEEKTQFRESTMSRNDLFSDFLKAGLKWPNKAAEPSRTTVTTPAGAGDRASGAPGSP